MSEHPLALHQAYHFSREKQVRFLEALALWGSVRAACRAVPVAPQTVYRARRSDADFALAWDAAVLAARPHVEDVLADRALNGVEEPVFYHGEEVARRRRYDGRLLLAHLARLDRAEDCGEVRAVAGDFDAALERLRRGEPVAPASDNDADDADRALARWHGGEPWLDESLPFTERVLLYLEHVGEPADDDEDEDDCESAGDEPEPVEEPDLARYDAPDCAAPLPEHDTDAECDAGEGADAADEAPPPDAPSFPFPDRVTPVTFPEHPERGEGGAGSSETVPQALIFSETRRRAPRHGPNIWSPASPFE